MGPRLLGTVLGPQVRGSACQVLCGRGVWTAQVKWCPGCQAIPHTRLPQVHHGLKPLEQQAKAEHSSFVAKMDTHDIVCHKGFLFVFCDDSLGFSITSFSYWA